MSRKPKSRADRIAAAEYDVGYGKPPTASQFGPGNRANPAGRLKGAPNHRTAVKRVLEKRIEVRENGRVRKTSQLEAAMQVLMNKALKGDVRAFGQLLAEGYRAGILNSPVDSPGAGVTTDDAAVVEGFLQRFGANAAPANDDAEDLASQTGEGPTRKASDRG